MIATVKSVEFNVQRGKGKGTILKVQAENGRTSDEFIFSNAPFHNTVAQLKSGMTVDLKKQKSPQGYWNVVGVEIVNGGGGGSSAPAPTGKSSSAPAAKSSFGSRYADSEDYVKHKDESINRQSSMKAAVELVGYMMAAGTFKKTATPDFIMGQVFKIAKSINHYTTLKDVDEALDSSMEDIEPFENGEDEDGFPG